MKVNLLKISSTVAELIGGLTDAHMLETGFKASVPVMEFAPIPMDHNMKDSSETTRSKVVEYSLFPIRAPMSVIGMTTSKMEKVSSHGLMVINLAVNGLKERVDKEH